ncbi:hemagglutinin repeat-containing protein [Marinomonas alcarazii]|uniref:endonuclease toxin domain-containing protein n=1 Tax=Marinomonas alcarazii TaxID=491949 RepID=UPI001C64D34D|nr:hemagglutinin repeat-containing protein [Marinomonas alcarazii]
MGLTIEGDISNSDGALIHADKALVIDAKGDLSNSNSIIETLTSAWVNVQNLFNTGTVLAQDESLSVEAVTVDNQGTLSGNGVAIKAAELDNTTSTAQIFSSDKLDLIIDGDVTNTDGALVHADTDLTIDAKGNVTNSATIEAVESTTVKSQNLSNSGTILAQDSSLLIETNKIENQGTLSGNGLVVNAAALDNRTENGKILSSDTLDLTMEGDITNTDGALIHADKALTINAKGDLNNSNSIIETLTTAWVKVQNLFNTGTVLAQDEDLTIEAVTVENQGTLSGNGLVIKAGELDNTTSTAKIVSSDKVDLTIDGDFNNTDSALVHAGSDVKLDAKGNLINSGTIEAVESATVKSLNLTNSDTVLAQNGAFAIETNQVDNQGTLAGNGITINAASLNNTSSTAQIFSSDNVDLNVEGDISNADGALVHADKDLTLDAKDDLTNSGTIEAVESAKAKSANLTNSGTVLAQNSALSIDTNKVDNQGVLAANGIMINAASLDNDTTTAQIFSSDKVDLNVEEDISNTDGALVHAEKGITLDAQGNVTNSGTLEAITSLRTKAKNVFNTGTVLSQDGELTIDTAVVDNQGVLAGNGITINAAELDNTTSTAQIFSSDKLDLIIDGDFNNTDSALVHAGTDVNLDAKGNLTNSGTIEAVESATVKSLDLINSGTVLTQNSALSIDTNKVDNQGVLAGNGITINAAELDNTTSTAQIFSSDKLDLIIDGDFNNADSALVHAGTDVRLDTKGNLTNSGSIEAVTSVWANVKNLFNTGTLLAQNSALSIDTNKVDNQGVLAGKGITINANGLSNSTANAKIFSSDKVELTIDGDFNNADSALVHAGTDVNLDAKGNLTNSGTIEAVESATVKSQNLTNSGTVLAQNNVLSIGTNKVDNQGVLAGNGITINANGLFNRTDNAKIFSSDKVDLIIDGDINNTDGALVHAGTDVRLDAKGNLTNSGTIEAVTSVWAKVKNLFNTGTVLAQNSALSIDTNKVHNQGVLAGNGITINAASLDNKTTNAKIFSSDKVDLTIDGDVNNIDGALVHAGTDVNLDAKGNLTNSGTIEAVTSVWANVKNLLNTGTVLAQNSALSIDTNKVENQGVLAGNGITINAASLDNDTNTAQIFSSDKVDLTIDGDVNNTDGALVHAGSDVNLDVKGNLTNSGSVEAVTSTWAKVKNLFNTGTVLAQNSGLTIDTNKVENQGVLAGNGININAASLDNKTANAKIFSSDKVDLTIDGDINNTDSALVHAGTDVNLVAKGNLTNSGTIEAVTSVLAKVKNLFNTGTLLAQDDGLSIEAETIDNQGALAGNGITINTNALSNSADTAKIFSSDKVNLTVQGNITNTDGALLHADTDLILDTKGDVTNSGTIEAVESATVKSENFTNSGTVLGQNSTLKVDTSQLDNQGVLAGNGITINANGLFNRTDNAKIFSSDKVDLIIDGDINNTDGALVHAGTDVNLDAKGDVTNSGTIEAVTSVWANVKNLFNTGTVLAQNSALSIDTKKVENQGMLAGNGITINAAKLDNTSNTAQIFSSDKVDLNVEGDISNTDGALLHADTDLILDTKGDVTNSGTIEAVESATVKSENFTNSGTVLGQNSTLKVDTNQLDNQGVLAGNGITINANGLFNRTDNAKIFSSDKVDLIIDGDINNTDGALVHAGTDVNLVAKGNLTNSGTIEAVTSVLAKVKNLFNTGTLLAQDDGLSIEAEAIDNQGALAGNGITINTNALSNSSDTAKIFSSSKVDLTIGGDLNNTDGALVYAGTDVNLVAKGNLTNSGTIEAVTSVLAKVKNLFNTGTLLAQDDGLSIEAEAIDNQGALAGNGITINANELSNSTDSGKIFSLDAVTLNTTGDVSNTDSALIHAGTDATITAAADLINSGTIEAVEIATVKSQNLTNSGTVLAQNNALSINTIQVDNQGVLAGNGIDITASELTNESNNAKIFSSDKVDLTIDGDINNTDGALVHAGTDVKLDVKGNLTNSGTIEAVESATIKGQNLTNTSTVMAQNSELTIDTNKVENQGVLAGNGITINTNELSSSTANAKIFSSDNVDLTIQGNMTNTDGALVHAGTDVNLDAEGNVINSGTIEAVESATVKSENFTNSGTVLAQNSELTIDTNKVDNQGVLVGNGITINANGLSNSTASAKIFSSDNVDLTVEGNITNTDGALVNAGTDVILDAKGSVTNSGSIEAVESATVKSENFTNSGTVLAQNSTLKVDTNQLDNQGVLAGNGITINAASLDNDTNTAKIFSSDKVDLTVEGDITNTDGALVHAGTDVNLDAKGDVTNSGTIEAVTSVWAKVKNLFNTGTLLAQNSALSIDTNKVDNQGVLAGNGITINANELSNSTDSAKIFSSDNVDLTVEGNITNTDGALVHAATDVTLDAKDNVTNSGTIEAVESATVKSLDLTNSGTVLAQNSALTIETNKVDNQGALAGNGITINANELSNSTASAKIFSSDKVDLTIDGDINNTDGALVHAGTDVNLDVKEDLTNSGIIEAIASADIKTNNIINKGKLFTQESGLTLDTTYLDNQGTIQGNGLSISADIVDNSTAQGKVYSTNALDLVVDGTVTNKDNALIHGDKTVSITSTRGNLVNTNATIESATNATLNSQNLTNSGTILAQDDTLTIRAQQLDNQGLLGGRNIDIEALLLNNRGNTSQIYANNNVNLKTTEGAITNNSGALIHAGNDLVLNAMGDLINSNATLESATNATFTSRNLSNFVNSTLLAQNGTLTINTDTLDNDGTLIGENINATAAVVNNIESTSNIFATGDLILKATRGNINNINGANIRANGTLTLNADADIINTGSSIESMNAINLLSHNLTNSGNALIRSNDNIITNWNGDFVNYDSKFEAKKDITTSQKNGNLKNTSLGLITAQNGTFGLTLGSLINQGNIGANRVELNTDGVSNIGDNGLIIANEHFDIRSTTDIDNFDGGVLLSLGSGYLQVNNTITNSSAEIEARGGDLIIDARSIVNKRSSVEVGFSSVTEKYVEEGEVKIIDKGQNERRPLITSQKIKTITKTVSTPYVLKNSSEGRIITGGFLEFKGYVNNIYSLISSGGGLAYNDGINNESLIEKEKTLFNGVERTIRIEHAFRFESKSGKSNFRQERRRESTRPFYNENSSSIILMSSVINSSGDITGKGGRLNNFNESSKVDRASLYEIDYNSLGEADGFIDKWEGANEIELNTSASDAYYFNLIPAPVVKITDNIGVKASIDTIATNDSDGVQVAVTETTANTSVSGQTFVNKATGTTNVKATDGIQVAITETSGNTSVSGQTFVNKATGTTNVKTTDGIQVGVKETSANTRVSGQTVVNTATGTANVKATDAIQVAVTETSADTSVSGQTVVNTATGTANVKATDGIQVGVKETSANTSVSDQVFVNTATGTTNVKATDGIQVAVKETSANSSVSGQAVANIATGTTNVKATDGIQVGVKETSANTSVSGQTVANTATGKTNVKASGVDGVQVAEKGSATTVVGSGTTIRAGSSTSPTVKNDASAPGANVIDLAVVAARRDEIFGDNLANDLVSSALFKESDSPEQNYLIETNPLLTNYKSFISSDYMLNKMIGDESGRTGKTTSRLGDGYLEQKLVRDQILSYTGFQTLPNDVDIEATYATLMNNAVEEYQDLGLSTGIELSDEQIAQLKKPIVWMVTETVQTASGPQQALVPKVYFSNTSDMTLRPDGALIAATNINIDAQEGINNSGTMLAKVDLSLKGNSIDNAGTIKAGGNAGLTATTDITNSGTMQAGGTLGLVAGGNITSETSTNVLTYNRGSYSATQTLVGDTATLQGANISLTAGNDITLIGSEVSASDKVFANAGKDFTLASLAVTNSTKDGAHYNQSSTTNQVTSLSGNNIQLSAGNTLTSQGAQINASGDLGLSASNINLFAVTDSKDQYSFVGGGGNSTKKRSHNESLTGSTLSAGGSLTLVSQQDIFSQGSALSSGEGMTLAAGGDITLAAAEAYNSSFKEVKKKKSGMFGSKRSTKTTTSESLTNLGTSLTSGGDIQMVSGSDILLSGTKASAAGNIGLQAVGGIQLLSAVDQTSSQYQEQKKGSFKVKAKDQGSIKQTAVTSELAGANISLTSGSSIALQGATLSANNTLSMGAATGTLQAVTKDTDGNYINDKGEQVGNVTVGTQALQSSEWSKSSSGFRGIFKDLAKGLAVVAAVGTGGLVHGDIKVGEADATRTDKLTQQTSTLAANNLAIEAQNNLALIGAKVSVADTASLSANDITIDAAHEQTVVTTSHTDETVSGKGATLQKDQISLASITETDQTERTTTTANTWQGSNISAGSLNLSANNNLAILASDINVDSNANIKGENILVGGRDATTDTTHDSITKTKTLDIGIRNSYVDVALATEGLKDAKDSVKEAERNYNDAKQKVADGKIPKEDLDLYQQKLDSAKKSEKLASLAVVNAGVTATLSSATAGFTATAGTSTQVTSNTTTATQSNWSGSTIKVGNNASLNGQNNLTVEGSAISSQGTLEANAKNIDILAGKNTYAETTSSQTKGASASVTASLGVGVSGSVGVNASESNSNSQSTQYSNSSLSAGTLASNSDNLSIKGGNLSGNEVVINTNNLDVISQQATSTSHSESQGKGINLGGSSNSDSVSVSYIQSQTDSDYASVTQQSSITAGDKGYQINVAGNTNLVGGLITSTDKAEASGNNAFSTGTLTQTDLANHAVYSGSSMGVDVGISSNTDSKGNSGLGFSNSMGQGSAGDSRQSTTQSGINTANLAITDADKQQQLTGQSVSQTLADAHTTTSTDTAEANSGVLKNTFNQAEVEQEINQQREVTQAFSKTVQEAKGAITNSINKQKDALNEQLADGKISQTEYDQQNDKLDNYSLLANTISAGLSVPTDSLAGQVAAAASPAVANQIGQYFKGLAADNENGQLNAGQETAHVLAHGILAAAVASAGGNDATTAGIAAAGSEAAAPALAKWLYDKDSSDDLTAAEKQTLTSIMGAASTTVGATTGNVNNAIAAGQAGQNAVENNFLGPQSLEALKKAREKLTVGNANIVVKLDGANQRSDQLLKQYNESPDSLSKSEKEKLGQYLNDYYNELVTEYGVEIAEKLTQNLFSDSPTVSDSALAYNFPYALDSATKTAAADKIRDANNPSVLDYLTGFRDKGENEQTYQKAVGILRVNAVNESNAEVGDTILLVSGIGEIAAATKAAPAFLKGFFGSSDKVVKGLGGVTDTTEIGMRWGKGIQNQGKPFEGYVQKNLPKGTIDLNTVKNNFKTFDHFNPIDGAAYSTKTLDTIGSKTYQNPSKITYTLNNYVKEMANFTEEGAKNGFNLVNSEIKSKTMQLGIPSETSAEQMTAIQKSIDYAAKLPTPINIIVTKVK